METFRENQILFLSWIAFVMSCNVQSIRSPCLNNVEQDKETTGMMFLNSQDRGSWCLLNPNWLHRIFFYRRQGSMCPQSFSDDPLVVQYFEQNRSISDPIPFKLTQEVVYIFEVSSAHLWCLSPPHLHHNQKKGDRTQMNDLIISPFIHSNIL